ncbi:MAG: glycoside hydrolase family 6 protein [Actinomycetes bacterium]
MSALAVLAGGPAAAVLLSDDHHRDVNNLLTPAKSTPTPTPDVPALAPPQPNPLAGQSLYVDPHSKALDAAAHATDARNAALLRRIGNAPQAFWYGDWVPAGQIAAQVREVVDRAAAINRVPVLVAYDIPVRDCHGYSGGGAKSPAAYREWIDAFATGVGGHAAIVILEPDALAQLDCLSPQDQATRVSLLRYAVHRLAQPKTMVYADAGHADWVAPATMAQRLRQIDVSAGRGFALNVSNFDRTSDEVGYGHAVQAALGDRSPFVIDTSRNGAGPASDHAWCNPPGRAVGALPTLRTGLSDVDAFLWVKRPGESDGTCNGGPQAGQFWTDYAIRLAGTAASGN